MFSSILRTSSDVLSHELEAWTKTMMDVLRRVRPRKSILDLIHVGRRLSKLMSAEETVDFLRFHHVIYALVTPLHVSLL